MYYYIALGYLAFINILSFIMFGIDKKRARSGKWRISEAALFMTAVLGGSLGALMGMYFFAHKTKHRLFTIGVPFVLLAESALAVFLLYIFLR